MLNVFQICLNLFEKQGVVIINIFYYSKGTKQKAKVKNKKYSILMNLFIDIHYLKSKLILLFKKNLYEN